MLIVLALLLFVGSAAAAQDAFTYWRTPGGLPYELEDRRVQEWTEEERLSALAWFDNVPAHIAEQAAEAMREPGTFYILSDGERFDRMLFREGGQVRVAHNIVVAFEGDYDRRAQYWEIVDADGTTYKFVEPYICGNLSVIVIPPPSPQPAPPSECFRVYFDFNRRQESQPTLLTDRPRQMTFVRPWLSDTQSMLYPETSFALVIAHIDVSDAERDDLREDDCWGYYDATGFHKDIAYVCRMLCARGSYPSSGLRLALRRERGIELPDEEPEWVFIFALAQGEGYLSIPLEYAERFQLYCVGVERHRVSTPRYQHNTSSFNWDTVSVDEVTRSLAGRRLESGDAVLKDEAGEIRYLYGEHQF
jgi:hypothetical protein